MPQAFYFRGWQPGRQGRGRLDFAVKLGHQARPWCGAVAQLGERVVRNDEVSGSIPLSSTN